VLPVTIRTVGRPLISRLEGDSVNALIVGLDDRAVARAARVGDLELVDVRALAAPERHVVRAVTIAATRGLGVSFGQGYPVDACLVIRDEAGRNPHLLAHLGIVQMTAQADGGLLGLEKRGLGIGSGHNGVRAMTIRAGWGPFHTFGEPDAVPGARVAVILLFVAFAAGAHDMITVDPGVRILRGEDVVLAVAIAAAAGAQGGSVDALVVAARVMTRLALDRLDGLRVREFGGVEALVAIDTAQRFVNRLFKDALVDIELDLASLFLHSHAGFTVAGETVFVGLPTHEAWGEQDYD